PARAGVSRQDPHPGGRRALPARDRGERLPRGRGEPEPEDRRAGAPMSEPLILLRGLRKSYGKGPPPVGIDLEIHERQIFGVVGPDGAGKSTLLRALVGLLEVSADEARVLGQDLRRDVTALKAQVGYVPQVFSLHRALTVAENLHFT